jgi:ankyrin repeat protein
VNGHDAIFGETPLNYAALEDRTEAMALLLENGADTEAGNKKGQSALACAANKGHVGVLRLLLDHGAERDAVTGSGNTALMAAAIDDQVETARVLIDSGASLHLKNDAGWSALDIALKRGPAVAALLQETIAARLRAQHDATAKKQKAMKTHRCSLAIPAGTP